ncbi:MAG: BCCT family transporter [Candidatus Marinimicrobia bacterium]|jgi:choline/glycine/proline betaine transport protein|nr:BCCT family transporter [Candidatus Neomarinimicrobiota bacterium]
MKNKFIDKLGLNIHPTVFGLSLLIIISFVTFTLLNLQQMSQIFQTIQSTIAHHAGWFYILSVNIFLGFSIYLIFSRYGKIRIGGMNEKPEFTYWGWFSMLFSAGMGIGLVFYSVAEPIFHYISPPYGAGSSIESAKMAMQFTFFHWGFHAWGIYAIVALALAFFSFNRGLPLTIRSAFYPLLGEKIYGPIGNAIDITAAVATLFGLTTSLGLGVKQINAGLHHLFGIAESTNIQIMLIASITLLATISVVLGLKKGIKRLSELNMGIALVLMIFVFVCGPTIYLLNSFLQNIGMYTSQLIELSFWTEAYESSNWQKSWTIFYWAWWISWSPFVGMFIARISKGRTIREFILSVLLVPTLLTFIWLTVFGNTALYQEMVLGHGIVNAVNENVAVALFVLLQNLPLSFFTSLLGVLLVITFFVSSSDSASLVIDIITAGGNTNPPTIQRIFWAITEGLVAIVLLLGGGLIALQTASIITGLFFAVILLFMCFSLLKGLREELVK